MHPVCFHIGPRPIYWYGVMMALAFLAGAIHWHLLGRREGRPPGLAGDLLFWIIVGGIAGARAAYVIAEFDYYRSVPWWHMLRVDEGGLIYYGGLLGAALATVLFARARRMPLLDLADFTITAVPLGHTLGRVGCFLNGCCFGRPVPPDAGWWTAGLERYPVQLYEAGLNLAIYLFLLWRYRTRPRSQPGLVLAAYLMCYPSVRYFMEFLRGDERTQWGALTVAQAVSLALFAAGLALFVAVRRHHDAAHRSA